MTILVADLQITGKIQWVTPGSLGPGIKMKPGSRQHKGILKHMDEIRTRRKVMPLEVASNGAIVDGEHRYKAMLELGVRRIPIYVGEQMGASGRLVKPYRGISVEVDLAESLIEGVKFTFFKTCDRFRRCLGGEADWHKMMRNKKRITQREFERVADPANMLDDGETLDDWIFASGGTEFFRSVVDDTPVYFLQAAGFEYIFLPPSIRKPPGVREASQVESHGLVGTPEHNSWRGMKMRCNNPNHKYFSLYGGRGISVHKTWNEFTTFLKDMGPRPKGHTLDRKNVNGGYGPGNCVWSDIVTQNRNRRNVTGPFEAMIDEANSSLSFSSSAAAEAFIHSNPSLRRAAAFSWWLGSGSRWVVAINRGGPSFIFVKQIGDQFVAGKEVLEHLD